jgi:multisubunit Na+/H+ antiporter MnhF subunit
MDAAALADIVVTGALLGFLATVALAWYVLETRR